MPCRLVTTQIRLQIKVPNDRQTQEQRDRKDNSGKKNSKGNIKLPYLKGISDHLQCPFVSNQSSDKF